MPLIKPRTRGKQVVRRMVRLDRETNETLFAYAHFLGESTDYVLNEVGRHRPGQRQGVSGLACRAHRLVRAAVASQSTRKEASGQTPRRTAAVRGGCCSPNHRDTRLRRGQEGRAVSQMILEQRALVAMLIAMGVGTGVSTPIRSIAPSVPADHRVAESDRVPGPG